MAYYRWSDNDRRFGPFIYAHDRRGYRPFGAMFSSGGEEDRPCTLRLSGFGHTLIAILPSVISPRRTWVDTSHYEWSKGEGSGYFQADRREYGFNVAEGAVHVHYGAQTNEWPGTKSKCYFLPWRSWRHVRHSLYDLEGEHFADLPEWGIRHKNGWAAKNAIEEACPSATFSFKDYDGEELTATTRIEEREWLLGEGRFKWLSLFRRPKIDRSLDIRFSGETGKRKGSWKGGTVGHSIEMLSGELHEAAFRRYCAENAMTFVATSGMSASGQDAQRLEAKPASPTAESGDAQHEPTPPGDDR